MEFTYRKVELSELNMMEKIYRLRYQVYVNECGFLKAEDYPDGIETDVYDNQSLQFAALNEDEDVIGTMRMILPGEQPLPILHHCPNVNFASFMPDGAPFVEISRLVISKQLRRRKNDQLYYEPQVEDQKFRDEQNREFLRRAKPMAFGLYREMYLESKRRGYTHWYTLMEKSLWLLLRLHGFKFEPIGDEVDVYGPVRPYVGEIARIEEEVYKRFQKFYDYFTSSLEKELKRDFEGQGIEPLSGQIYPLESFGIETPTEET